MLTIGFALALLSTERAQEAAATGTNASTTGSANPQASLLPGVTVIKDIEYVPAGGAARTLDLYLPPSSGKPMPLLIFIHGGGWHSGSKDGCPAKFLAEHGYAVASINYRLTPEAIFPAQIEDCRAALKFLRAEAAKYHLQPDHVGVWGGSAGAHLALLLGTAPAVDFSKGPGAPLGKTDESLRVQCVVDMYGPSHFTASQKFLIKLLGPSASEEEMQAKARWASPMTYVSRENPPMLIQHGDADTTVPLEQSRMLADALKAAGVEVTFTVMPGGRHAGAPFFTEENHKTVLEFLDKHLKR